MLLNRERYETFAVYEEEGAKHWKILNRQGGESFSKTMGGYVETKRRGKGERKSRDRDGGIDSLAMRAMSANLKNGVSEEAQERALRQRTRKKSAL